MDIHVAKGREALLFFHNQSTKFSAYGLSFEELLSKYGKKADIYAEAIGLAILSNEVAPGDVRDAMEGLANAARGRVPKDHQEYIKFIGNEASQVNYLDLTKAIAQETVKQATEGAASLGDNLKLILSSLNFLLPIMVVGAVLFIFTSRVKSVAGKK